MQQTIGFLSEWGNDSLDFTKRGDDAPTTHFIVTAVLLDNEKLPTARRILEAVRGRHFNGATIDSNLTGKNHEKRKEILEDKI